MKPEGLKLYKNGNKQNAGQFSYESGKIELR
jgi:hypothetical protein